MGQIPSETWQIQPMTPFDIDVGDFPVTEYDLPAMEGELPLVVDTSAGSSDFIDTDPSIPPN